LTCHGSVYDVDGDPTNGCEIRHNPSGPTRESAIDLGSKGCATRTRFTGRIVSDARPHDPAPPGFDDTTGAAPNFWRAIATGGNASQCPNGQKFDAIIATSGGSGPGPCYRLTVFNGAGFVYGTRDVSGSGITGIHNIIYPSNADLIFKFEKICGTNVREDINVTIDFVVQ